MNKIKEKNADYKILRLIKYTWYASPKTFIFLILVSFAVSLLGFFELIVIEKLFSYALAVSNGDGIRCLYFAMCALLCILILNPIAEWLEFLIRGYFWRRSSGYMKGVYHSFVGRMDAINFEDSHYFDELKKADDGSEDAPDGLRILIQIIFFYVPYVFSLFSYLLNVSRILSLIIVLIFIPTLVAEIIRMKESFSFQDSFANQKRQAIYFENCIVSKDYFKEMLLNGSFEFFNMLFTQSNRIYGDKYISVRKKILKTSLSLKILNVLGFIGILVLLVHCAHVKVISIGLFAAVYYSISKITTTFKRIIEDVGDALDNISTTSFLMRLLAIDSDLGKTETLEKNKDIILENVTFRYPNEEKQVLKNVNLTIKAGSTIAIVGENGSGKTTLAKIILGLYKPDSGKVLIGNEDSSEFAKTARFKDVSAVFQDYVRYKLSLKDNIIISEFESLKEVQEALEQMQKLNIDAETILARDYEGRELSGGEWQRVAIARGLYRHHDLIILDEPTASIDPIEEADIFYAFKKISANKTCVFITHRLGATKFADRILVLENGMIVEDGSHTELMKMKGKYYYLLKSQAQWYEREEVKHYEFKQ